MSKEHVIATASKLRVDLCADALQTTMMRRILIAILCCASTLAAQRPQSAASSPNTITLDEAVQEALSKNLDLAVQRYDISVAEARG